MEVQRAQELQGGCKEGTSGHGKRNEYCREGRGVAGTKGQEWPA